MNDIDGLVQDCSNPTANGLELLQSCTQGIMNDIDGLVQDCSNPTANGLELLQSCTKPAICICFTPAPHSQLPNTCKIPPNSWRSTNVVITSKRRHFDVITTSLLRNVSAGSVVEAGFTVSTVGFPRSIVSTITDLLPNVAKALYAVGQKGPPPPLLYDKFHH